VRRPGDEQHDANAEIHEEGTKISEGGFDAWEVPIELDSGANKSMNTGGELSKPAPNDIQGTGLERPNVTTLSCSRTPTTRQI
jgi:hypothetical protein